MGLSDLEAIPESGAVFTVGRSRFADNIASHFFIRKDPVVSITCGDEHSAVICQSGRLFVFGSNDWGQLGLGHRNHISKPSCVKVLKPEKVTHVACGRAHTLISTGAQKIFACGSDQEGQLGRGTSAIGDSSSSPVLVYDAGLAGSKILQLAAGSHHSLALISDGGVFAWGSNLEGQLGLPDVSGLVNKPTKVHIPEPVKQISAGYYHSAFLTESGLVYICGESESGKLGIDVNFSTQITPKQMQLPSPAVHVACGGHHTVVLAENGNIYCTGSNSNGQLGLGTNVTELHTPKLLSRGMLQNETISRISCGESHTAIVTESGKLFTCGDGRHGKLGLEENENNVHELTFVQRYKELFVSKVACGGCHTILLGQRREMEGNHTAREISQTEHMQKRNSLPPLKLPVNKLHTDPHEENTTDTVKAQINPEKPALPPMIEAQLDNETNNEENTTDNARDSMNNVEKVDSPQESSHSASQKTPDTIVDKMESEIAQDEASVAAEESQESKEQNEKHELTNDNEKVEPKVDAENNIKENASETNNEQTNKENNNEVTNEASKNDEENHTENTEKDSETDNKQSNDENEKSEAMNEKTESNTDGDKEKSSEKQMSPIATPPPKPPRLKPGSASSDERTSEKEKENENKDVENGERKEDSLDKEEETKEDESKKQESNSMKSSAKSKSSKSRRSIADAEDTIEIDKQDDKEKIVDEERTNADNAQDDADVVQSPPPKTGRISKMFKAKKPQATENGTKTAGAVSHKPKSKTCSIL
nr:PREDICTED: X-linked retinitis pigmentosa GTPase regulator [Megachile rotundata]